MFFSSLHQNTCSSTCTMWEQSFYDASIYFVTCVGHSAALCVIWTDHILWFRDFFFNALGHRMFEHGIKWWNPIGAICRRVGMKWLWLFFVVVYYGCAFYGLLYISWILLRSVSTRWYMTDGMKCFISLWSHTKSVVIWHCFTIVSWKRLRIFWATKANPTAELNLNCLCKR